MTTTDANGFYRFGNLRKGTYSITETQPLTWTDGKDTIGSPGGITNNDQFSNIALPGGFDGVNNNFGEVKFGQLSGTVFNDSGANGFNNGVQDFGEAGIANVTIQLNGINGNGQPFNLSTTTNGAGFYHSPTCRPAPTPSLRCNRRVSWTARTRSAPSVASKPTTSSPASSCPWVATASITTSASCRRLHCPASSSRTPASAASTTASSRPASKASRGVTINLDGTDDKGAVHLVTTTDRQRLLPLRQPASRHLHHHRDPAGRLADGKDTIGTPGGTTGQRPASPTSISLPASTARTTTSASCRLAACPAYVYADTDAKATTASNRQASWASQA